MAVRQLGKHQLERLMSLASPSTLMVVGDKVSKSLVKRGMLRPYFETSPDAFHQITPAGLRYLAVAHEAGWLAQFMRKFPNEKPPVTPH